MLKRLKDWLDRKAEARRIKREKRRIIRHLERHRLTWELLRSGRTMRDQETEKSEIVIVDYRDTRMMGQRNVTPNIIRPFGIGRWRL